MNAFDNTQELHAVKGSEGDDALHDLDLEAIAGGKPPPCKPVDSAPGGKIIWQCAEG